MTIIDDFKARFPELDETQIDATLPNLILVYPYYWGGSYEACGQEIVLNLLAHLFVVQTNPGTGNTKSVQSKSVGNVSTSFESGYAPGSGRASWFRTTKYGMQFLMLSRQRQGGFFV